MLYRTPLPAIAVVAVLLGACGDGGAPPDVAEPAGSISSADTTTGPRSTPSGSTTSESSVAPSTRSETPRSDDGDDPDDPDDLADSDERLARCSEVPEASTDVDGGGGVFDIDPVFHGVLLTYADEHAETFGGLWIDRDANGTIVLAFTDDPAPHRAALAERRPSPDDIPATEPRPDITDDRPIGEWDVAFDVVQVDHTESDLVAAIPPVLDAVQAVVDSPTGGGTDLLRNRMTIDLSTPITPDELDAISEAVGSLDGVGHEMVCWSGQFVDEAPEPIEPGTPLDVIELPREDGTYPTDTPVTCDGLTFELGDLADLTPAAEVEPALRAVLDDWLGSAEGQFWPQDGWSLLYERGDRALFLRVADLSYVRAEMGTSGWIWAGAGGGGPCDVRLMLPDGVGRVDWVFDPAAPPPDASSTEVHLLATERGCASGREMGERLLGPQVVETDDAVRIAFAVIPLGGAQECPGNPAEPVTVRLDRPLGDREIRDGLVIAPIESLLDG